MQELGETKFQVTEWDEKDVEGSQERGEAIRLTRAHVAKSFEGALTGASTVEYVMAHREDGTASFVGVEQFRGALGERSGSFAMEHRGTFSGGVAKGSCRIIEGSSTGNLEGICGEGSFEAAGREAPFRLSYQLG